MAHTLFASGRKMTTDRHSRGYHARQLRSSSGGLVNAEQLHRVLRDALAADPSLADNPYFTDAIERADNLIGEMEDDMEASIEAAAADGYGPEDFE